MNWLQRYFRRPQQLLARRLNFQLHLWAGIILTLYWIVIGVTGSILVFRPELQRICGLKPWQNIQVRQPFADIRTVVENLRAAYPRGHIVSVMAPTDNDATFVAVLQGRGQMKVACGPTDGKVLGEFPSRPNWLGVVQRLHETLLAGRRGRLLNGAGAALLLLLNVTGLVIWWPGIRNWRRALKVDVRRSWRRINFDLHSSAGFWTILITSFWALSGIYFAWPRQALLFVNSISPVISARPPVVRVRPEGSRAEPDLGSMVRRAEALEPRTRFGGIAFPYSSSAPLAVWMRRRDSPGYEYVDTVYFNPYNGDYISTWRYGVDQSLGDLVVWSQVPLHFGTYWGLGVKVIWATAGLAIPALAVTGLLMYWNRALRRKWRRRRRPGTTTSTEIARPGG
jgi:uncharacterized iron-regulated membrane protein